MSGSPQTEKNMEPKPFYPRLGTSITKLFYLNGWHHLYVDVCSFVLKSVL